MAYFKSYADKLQNQIKPAVKTDTPPLSNQVSNPGQIPPSVPAQTTPIPQSNLQPTIIASKAKNDFKNLLGYLSNPWVIASTFIIIAFSVSLFLFLKYQDSQKKLSQATLGITTQDETKKIIAEVGNLIVLPVGQTPTIATVTNVEKLRESQPFFNVAQNGDKLLIFQDKAILYRPSEKKIVDIGPVNRNQEATSSSSLQTSP